MKALTYELPAAIVLEVIALFSIFIGLASIHGISISTLCVCVCVCVFVCACMCVCVCVCVFVCEIVIVCEHMYRFVFIIVCVFVYVCVCVYVCVTGTFAVVSLMVGSVVDKGLAVKGTHSHTSFTPTCHAAVAWIQFNTMFIMLPYAGPWDLLCMHSSFWTIWACYLVPSVSVCWWEKVYIHCVCVCASPSLSVRLILNIHSSF